MRLVRAGAAAAAVIILLFTSAPARAQGATQSSVLVIEVYGVSFERLLSMPEIRTIASYGGAALLSHPDELALQATSIERTMTTGVGLSRWQLVDLGYVGGTCPVGMAVCHEAGAAQVGVKIANVLRVYDDRTITVFVASIGPSASMEAQKDRLTGLAMGRLEASQAVPYANIPKPPPLNGIHSLTSDSTRRSGVVVGSDLAPTVGPLIGLTTQQGLPTGGSPIRVVDEPAPFALHQRYLAQRRMYVPFGIGAATYVAIVALISLAVIAFRRRLPPWAAAAAGTLVLSMPIFFVSLLEVGRLSALDYASAAAFVVLFTFVGTAAAIAIGRGLGVAGEVISSAGIALAILIFESLTGWPSTLTPLLGGSALDGGRYYGMPNVEIGLMLGASVMVAYRLGHIWGAALIAACGLLAGLPWTWAGANLGASVTLFSAAGLWFGLGSAKRVFSLRTVLATGTVTIVGSAIVLLTNRLWPGSPTHITNFISGTGRTAGGIAHTIVERLGVGVRLIRRNAFALIPVLGVPAAIVLVLRPPAVISHSFERLPGWREALMTILLGSVVAYVANDSGAAALGLGFGMASVGLMSATLRTGAIPEQRVSVANRAHMIEHT